MQHVKAKDGMQTAFITQEAFRQVLLFFQFQPQSIRHLPVLPKYLLNTESGTLEPLILAALKCYVRLDTLNYFGTLNFGVFTGSTNRLLVNLIFNITYYY